MNDRNLECFMLWDISLSVIFMMFSVILFFFFFFINIKEQLTFIAYQCFTFAFIEDETFHVPTSLKKHMFSKRKFHYWLWPKAPVL